MENFKQEGGREEHHLETFTDDDTTPFYTPMDFPNSFEFPSPTCATDIELTHKAPPPVEHSNRRLTTKPNQVATASLTRKLRRFSLHERRSCSPQHLLVAKNATAEDKSSSALFNVYDKENAKPLNDEENLSSGGTNSPIAIIDETAGSGASPKLISNNDASRLTPKLLASLNNLNISGSPLGVINSAGYKNGNYFKFPEIDHHVDHISSFAMDAQLEQSTHCDNHHRTRPKNTPIKGANISFVPTTTTSLCSHPATSAISNFGKTLGPSEADSSTSGDIDKYGFGMKSDCRKNRKNKNNLTIRITTDMSPGPGSTQQQLASPKPKTPTIKNTKEKALSLDSAAINESAGLLSIAVAPGNCSESHASCNQLDAPGAATIMQPLWQRCANLDPEKLQSTPFALRSTSLSHLSTFSSEIHSKSLTNLNRNTRRRGKITSLKGVDADSTLGDRFCLDSDETSLMEDDEDPNGQKVEGQEKMGSAKHIQTASVLSTPHRSAHKHNPLLHASNTNLKTLPEFLTLVEFTTSSPKENRAFVDVYPHKQKSMESATHPPIARTKNVVTSNSSTNLLQRRGSNHSLTLNLHGSCSNLLGSCRSGLSVSNSTLNSKSSCNLNTPNTQSMSHTPAIRMDNSGVAKTIQRRGSNQSTNLVATSCGNLNSFASQNSLNVAQGISIGVTRTTSFITPTKNTPSHTKRGLLERRGSNQSLTLNMGGSIGGIGSERNPLATSNLYLMGDSTSSCNEMPSAAISKPTAAAQAPACCGVAQAHYQRKFFSSEELNKANTQFSDLNQAHKRDSNQICFGSVSDLKPCNYNTAATLDATTKQSPQDQRKRGQLPAIDVSGVTRKDHHFDFQESKLCTCTGVRNIMTRPLSPQTTSEEFKIYLANIQMLQNASNALNQLDLIKLNYIFDNSYACKDKADIIGDALPVLNSDNRKEPTTTPPPPALLSTTSEDCEIATRYEKTTHAALSSVLGSLDEKEQKRMFRDLHKEFWDLPLNHQEKPMVFGSQAKNRYKTILPNENSRVILEREHQQLIDFYMENEEKESCELATIMANISTFDEAPYINANYIKGPDYTSKCYVATQGPLPNTIYEFWLLIYQNSWHHFRKSEASKNPDIGKDGASLQHYCQKIVMLTNFLENNRQKCSVYFPIELHEVFIAAAKQMILTPTETLVDFFEPYLQPSTNSCSIESFKVGLPVEMCANLPPSTNFFVIKNVGIVRKNGFSIRKFLLLYCVQFSLTPRQLLLHRLCCYHYWYPDWPDHRSPRDINTLVDICLHVLNLGKCETEFETFSEQVHTQGPQRHLRAQNVNLYQQDIFNVVQPLPIIHCSAGIGRTGCLTAIINGMRQLRQSLAYSLTSMAAAKDTSGTHVPSPVDFCLPQDFVSRSATSFDEEDYEAVAPAVFVNDTDSSYSRNTILYITYILNGSPPVERQDLAARWELPTLARLPKLPDIFVDILGIVCNLRLQRGGMVQNSEQYELIHRSICLYLKRTFALKRF